MRPAFTDQPGECRPISSLFLTWALKERCSCAHRASVSCPAWAVWYCVDLCVWAHDRSGRRGLLVLKTGLSRMSRWIAKTLLVMSASAWSLVLVVVGVLMMGEWPERFGFWVKPWLGCGAAMACAGVFLFAVTCGRVFPLANRRVKAMFEVAPWLALLGTLIGVATW